MSWIERHGFSTFGSFNLSLLGIDQAWINVTNRSKQPLWLYELSSDCLECPFKLKDLDLQPDAEYHFIESTKFPRTYRFRNIGDAEFILENDESNMFCDVKASFGEFGIYDLVAGKDNPKCEVRSQLDPVNIYFSIVIVFLFYCLLSVACILWKKYKVSDLVRSKINTTPGSLQSQTTVAATPAKPRLQSLDTFRGLCIIIMVFVNDGGADYYFFEHATWDGLYFADLVFPWFLWIMGVCIPVSIKSQLKRKTPKLTILKAVLIRSLKLIGIGLILASKSGPVDIERFRLPGVLQRFGICYFVAAASVLLCGSDQFVENRKSANKIIASIQDILFIWKGWIVSGAILAIHTLLTFYLRIPGCPTGYLGPGGLHKGNAYPSHCIGGAAGFIDRQVLTINHIYKYPTALFTYESEPYDPEGILGTLTSIFQVWLGVQAGLTLQVYQKPFSRIWRWALWAVVTGAIGAALCGAKQTGGAIPVNKNLWSLSYVMVTTSFALSLLLALYIVIDVKKWWSGTPFFEPGMNSILLYIGHSVGYRILPFHFAYKDDINTHFLKLIESLWGTSLWVLIAIHLHNRKFFWSV